MKFIRSVGRGVGKVVKPFVNFPAWMGWGQIKSSGKIISNAAKDLVEQSKQHRQETFDQAVARFHLTEQDLQKRMTLFKRMAGFYLGVALLLLCYAFYMMMSAYFAAAFLSFVLAVLAGSLSLRQHFWYYQMKQRRLGCTLKEWFHDTFGGARR